MDDDVMAMLSSMCGDDDMYFVPLISADNFDLEKNIPEPAGPVSVEAIHHQVDTTNDIADHSDDSFSSGPSNPRKRKCVAPSNPDAVLVDQATDEKLRQLNIDPNSREGKKERRRIRNRLSAQMHRERKQAYIETLEYEVQLRDQRILALENQLNASMAECAQLKTTIAALAGSTHPSVGGERRSNPPAPSLFQAGPTPNEEVIIRRLRAGTAMTSSEGSDTEGSIDAPWACDDGEVERDAGSNVESPIAVESCSSGATPDPLPLFGTAVSSNADRTSAPPSRFHPSVSMFSIVLLLGITFFSGSFLTNPSGPAHTLSLSAPHHRPSPDMLLVDRRVPDGRVYTSGRVLLALPAEEESQEQGSSSGDIKPEVVDNSRAVGKWTPLRLTAPVHHWSTNEDFHTSPISHDEDREVGAREPKQSPQIWKYQNHITTIYPTVDMFNARNDSNAASEGTDAESELETSDIPGRKYLRASLSSLPSADTPVRKTTAPTSVFDRGNFPFYYDSTWPAPSSAMSKVLITEGRVLLDPVLAASATGMHASTPSAASERGLIPSSWLAHSAGPTAAASPSTSSATDGPLSSNQLLTMLVPASAVQWGGSAWVDGDSPDNSNAVMNRILRSLNLTGVVSTDPDTPIDLSSLWVEIGCNVLKARIVQDVSVLDGRDM